MSQLDRAKLFHDRRRVDGSSEFEVVSATTQVDHVGVMGVLQDALEIARAERLAIAAKQLKRTLTGCARRCGILALDQRLDGATHEIKGLAACETLSAGADAVGDRFTERDLRL